MLITGFVEEHYLPFVRENYKPSTITQTESTRKSLAKMAVEAVAREPFSPPIPCEQGKMHGNNVFCPVVGRVTLGLGVS